MSDFTEFGFIQQEQAIPQRFVVEVRSLSEQGDVHVTKHQPILIKAGVSVPHGGFAIAKTLDFRACQYHPRLEFLQDLVFEIGLAVHNLRNRW
jgi:hypothetical protein